MSTTTTKPLHGSVPIESPLPNHFMGGRIMSTTTTKPLDGSVGIEKERQDQIVKYSCKGPPIFQICS
jgi:hypothetical protein